MFVLISWILGFITPDYDWKNDYISELSLGKYGLIQKVNFIFCGLTVIGLCLLLATRTPNELVRLGWYLGSGMGILTALAGVWDTDEKRPNRTLTGKWHELVYHLGMLGTGAAYLLIGWGYRNVPTIMVSSLVVAVFDLLWWKFHTKLGIKPGVGQRVVIYSALLWVEVMVIWTMWQ